MSEDESYIVKPRDVSAIVRTADKDLLSDLFEDPLNVVVESITGWLASGPKEWALATGRIVQGALKVRLFQQVAAEIEEFRKKGRVPEDFGKREGEFQTWVELFTVIDEETPDKERLEAIKAMFFAANRTTADDTDRIVGYQLFQIAKKLSSGELLLLKTINQIRQDSAGQQMTYIKLTDWGKEVTTKPGHSLVALVRQHEKALVENELITPAHGIQVMNAVGRMTDLGIKFCENIELYQIDKTS